MRFFGLHFDFHAGNEAKIGYRTNPEDIEWYIQQANPDYIQCDCKGVSGNCCYPSNVGKTADNLQEDNLKIWSDTVHKHNLPIYVHYAGIWDQHYTKTHPEEAVINHEGKVTECVSIFNNNYVDNYMVPQIKEIIDKYHIDGMWVDGDCWAVCRDFSASAQPYIYEGIDKREHRGIMKEAFKRYVKRYVDAIHAYAPDFKIASNWMYTSYMPEKPTVNVDFISGDYTPKDSLYASRYEGRCIAAQDMPWDLMSWTFTDPGVKNPYTEKPAVQMMQEAAMVLMLGGGFQIYIMQNNDGSAKRYKGDRVKRISDFVHARKFNFQKKPVAQVGVLYSADSYYHDSNTFNAAGVTEPLIGVLNCILDAQYTANVVMEYQMDKLSEYDIMVIPQWKYIGAEVKNALLEYAKNGGNLVIVGAECCMQFGELTDKNFTGAKDVKYKYILDDDGNFARIEDTEFVHLGTGKEPFYYNNDMRDAEETMPAYRVDSWGEGQILFIPFDMGSYYFSTRSYIMINFLKKILMEAKKPLVEINHSNIDISMQKEENGILLNLLNMNQGRHSLDFVVYDKIPPQYDVEVIIHKPFTKVTMPLGEDFECECGEDFVKIRLKKLEIHSVIRLEEQKKGH